MRCEYCGSKILVSENCCPCCRQELEYPQGKGSCVKLIGIMIASFLGVTLFLSLTTGCFQKASESGRRASCSNNLKQIGNALFYYKESNNSLFPHGTLVNGKVVTNDKYGAENAMEILRSLGHLTDHKVYVCPSSEFSSGKDNEPLAYNKNLAYGYVYVPEDNPNVAISADLTGDNIDSGEANHDNFGNLLYADGHVRGFVAKKWHTAKNTGNVCVYPNELD